MNLGKTDLAAASEAGVITAAQARDLWEFLSARQPQAASFRTAHILYYLGGLIAIGAMTLFMNEGWELLGGWGLLGISACYATLGLLVTNHLLFRKGLQIPAGITATFVLALVPLAVYGLQQALGWRPEGWQYRHYHQYIDWNWLMMEYATLAAGAALVWRYRLPFLLMPVAVTLWYISMDIVPFLFDHDYRDWELRKLVSLYFGLGMILLAFWVDLRSGRRQDYAFWLYLSGALTFWGGLSLMRSHSEWSKFVYLCINLAMIATGALLGRRVFAVFGGLGVAGYLHHLAAGIFKDSLLFPLALSLIGFAIVYSGLLWTRHEARVTSALRRPLPAPLRELLERV